MGADCEAWGRTPEGRNIRQWQRSPQRNRQPARALFERLRPDEIGRDFELFRLVHNRRCSKSNKITEKIPLNLNLRLWPYSTLPLQYVLGDRASLSRSPSGMAKSTSI